MNPLHSDYWKILHELQDEVLEKSTLIEELQEQNAYLKDQIRYLESLSYEGNK
jgi:hypothetical protein